VNFFFFQFRFVFQGSDFLRDLPAQKVDFLLIFFLQASEMLFSRKIFLSATLALYRESISAICFSVRWKAGRLRLPFFPSLIRRNFSFLFM